MLNRFLIVTLVIFPTYAIGEDALNLDEALERIPEARTILSESAAACHRNELGDLVLNKGSIRHVSLQADELKNDLILDFIYIKCADGWYFSGTAGASKFIYMNEVFIGELYGRSIDIVTIPSEAEVSGLAKVILLGRTGFSCGEANFRSCYEAIQIADGDFVRIK